MVFSPQIILFLEFLGLLNCLAAFLLGGSAERFGAVTIFLNIALSHANEAFFQGETRQLVELGLDALTALSLLILTIRYASLWLGAVMFLYALQFSLHAYYFVLELKRDALHVVLNNANTAAVNMALLIGAIAGWLRRRKAYVAPASLHEPMV